MFDPERLLGQMMGGTLGGVFGGGRRRGGSVFSTGSIGGKATLGVGLLGIAMAAWEHYQQKPGTPTGGAAAGAALPTAAHTGAMPPPPPAGMPPVPATRPMPVLDDQQQSVVLLIRAMIAAANADGQIDATERETILRRARDSGLDGETLTFLDAELAKPQSLQQVVANATPALAPDIYAASAIAITADTDAEKQWLDMLAAGLRLDAATRADIDARIVSPA